MNLREIALESAKKVFGRRALCYDAYDVNQNAVGFRIVFNDFSIDHSSMLAVTFQISEDLQHLFVASDVLYSAPSFPIIRILGRFSDGNVSDDDWLFFDRWLTKEVWPAISRGILQKDDPYYLPFMFCFDDDQAWSYFVRHAELIYLMPGVPSRIQIGLYERISRDVVVKMKFPCSELLDVSSKTGELRKAGMFR